MATVDEAGIPRLQSWEVQRGRFLIFIGGDQVGAEDFESTKTSARSAVEMSVGGRASRARIELALSPQMEVESYRLEASGTCLNVTFEDDIAKFEAAGMSRQTKVCCPRVVLENNVYIHYQILLGMYDHSDKGIQSFTAVVPTADASVPLTIELLGPCLLYTSPSPRDRTRTRMPSSA